jgi:hypothetical protein
VADEHQERIAACPMGRHEALHMAHVAVCIFEDHVAEHPAVALNPRLKAQAQTVTRALADFYQAVATAYP